MSAQNFTRWTCDRCNREVEQSGQHADQKPTRWRHLQDDASFLHSINGLLCRDCGSALERWWGAGGVTAVEGVA